MYQQVRKLISFPFKIRFFETKRYFNNTYVDVQDEVKFGLETGKPIVALESTIITHGMPYPDNIECTFDVENIIRGKGAIPATVAIIKGRIKVGLSKEELAYLGDKEISNPIKTSRRDLPYLVSNKLNGGTTVSGTLIVANKVAIPVFATGGIGGVHREFNKTLDISADLTELGRSGVAVVSSGVKSILDIPKTLEYLETQGVFVATFGSNREFPAFYSRVSGSQAPYNVKNALEAATIIKYNRDLDLCSGMLFAVPAPEEYALQPAIINNAIEEALKRNKEHRKVEGKDVTPYLLSEVAKITGGKSLKTNIALIKNNAKVAAEIAVELAKLDENHESRCTGLYDTQTLKGKPVVIGGSNLDCSVNLSSSDIKLDGRIHDGRFSYTAGGVGRNICESLSKLGYPPNFISTVGDDEQGKLLKTFIPPGSQHMLRVLKGHNTAQCIIVFDRKGECKFLMGDMQIHQQITPEVIQLNEDIIKTAPLIVLDANLSLECFESTLKLATKYSIPVLFEPTDVEISDKPFKTPYWKAIKLITPNLNELKHVTTFLNIPKNTTISSPLDEAIYLAKQLASGWIENVIVTLGPSGVLIARRGLATDSLLNYQQTSEVLVRHYPCNVIEDFVNVSGAGDCLASGIVVGILKGLSEARCLSIGFSAAKSALYSQSAVPEQMLGETLVSGNVESSFQTIHL
ncbi:pseudouridine-metabolizing bifunctional protein C1861.05 [Anoplophora glabripennis]|uniref:pseudouridine-metabolizing bifunctional protein C1861.05 n=1 Tax=Anoplophora glabripennis TaxID=217634 RepID=UPI00087448DF|nr:pseudouridine-metabolizing bifunctional protein C1861.05 [Anoplophora glabripennis]